MNKQYTIKSRGLFKCDSDKPFKISRSQIEAFVECPRCFYLNHRHGIRRPSGLGFSINLLVDRMLKKEFDAHRAAGTPHPIMVENEIDAVPFQHEMMDDWRTNFKGMTYIDELNDFKITGSVDDVWQQRDRKLVVVDYKATATSKIITLDDDWKISYKRQMDIYVWLLRKQGLDVDDRGFFLYANGCETEAFDRKIDFSIWPSPYVSNTAWIAGTLVDMKACLLADETPSASDDCEFCGSSSLSIHQISARRPSMLASRP